MADNVGAVSMVTVKDCREAIRVAEWELLRLKTELAERERVVAEQRRAYRSNRKIMLRIRRKCRDRERQIEAMRELIRSGSATGLIDVGEAVESEPAGVALLERLGELMSETDAATESGLRAFFERLTDLQEFAKDFFDYAGVRLVYELGELIDQASGAPPDELDGLFKRVSELRVKAEGWFVGRS